MKWLVVLLVLLGLATPTMTQAQCLGSDWPANRPYGDHCYDSRWGWYGAKRTGNTDREAKKLLQEYYADSDVRIGKIVEKELYFKAEILDRYSRVVDRVIVDKRTGRIRSTY